MKRDRSLWEWSKKLSAEEGRYGGLPLRTLAFKDIDVRYGSTHPRGGLLVESGYGSVLVRLPEGAQDIFIQNTFGAHPGLFSSRTEPDGNLVILDDHIDPRRLEVYRYPGYLIALSRDNEFINTPVGHRRDYLAWVPDRMRGTGLAKDWAALARLGYDGSFLMKMDGSLWRTGTNNVPRGYWRERGGSLGGFVPNTSVRCWRFSSSWRRIDGLQNTRQTGGSCLGSSIYDA